MKPSEKCYVCVLHSVSAPDRHYVGLADDLLRHLASHNRGQQPHTARHGPWRLHVVMKFSSADAAARFERILKSTSGRAFTRTYLSG